MVAQEGGFMPKITRKFLNSLTPPTRREHIWDDALPGFGVVMYPSGEGNYVLKYRVGKGRNAVQKMQTLGGIQEVSPEEARKTAGDWKHRARQGDDPAASLNKANRPRMSDLCTRYIDEHAPSKRTGTEDKRRIKKIIEPNLGKKFLDEIAYADIKKLHGSLSETPYEANRVLALLSVMFSLADPARWNMRDAPNPCAGIKRYPEAERTVYLSEDNARAVLTALTEFRSRGEPDPAEGRHGDRMLRQSADAIMLLLLTGARKSEVLRSRWQEWDLNAGSWTKPSAHTKTARTHRVPVSASVIERLRLMWDERVQDELLFPSEACLEVPQGDIKKAWAAILKRVGLSDVRLHDLRHTFASIAASGGATLPMIGGLLGHTQVQTTKRYAHLFDSPLREAVEAVSSVAKRSA